jgi:hypothetical protein
VQSKKGIAQKNTAEGVTAQRPKFRFMDLEIWQDAIEIAGTLFDLADSLEKKKFYRFA